jgi:hypothetical protein
VQPDPEPSGRSVQRRTGAKGVFEAKRPRGARACGRGNKPAGDGFGVGRSIQVMRPGSREGHGKIDAGRCAPRSSVRSRGGAKAGSASRSAPAIAPNPTCRAPGAVSRAATTAIRQHVCAPRRGIGKDQSLTLRRCVPGPVARRGTVAPPRGSGRYSRYHRRRYTRTGRRAGNARRRLPGQRAGPGSSRPAIPNRAYALLIVSLSAPHRLQGYF